MFTVGLFILFQCYLTLYLTLKKTKNKQGTEHIQVIQHKWNPTYLGSTCVMAPVRLMVSLVSSTLRTLPKKSVMRTLPGSLRKRSVRWPGVDTHWLLGQTLNCGQRNMGKLLKLHSENTHLLATDSTGTLKDVIPSEPFCFINKQPPDKDALSVWRYLPVCTSLSVTNWLTDVLRLVRVWFISALSNRALRLNTGWRSLDGSERYLYWCHRTWKTPSWRRILSELQVILGNP